MTKIPIEELFWWYTVRYWIGAAMGASVIYIPVLILKFIGWYVIRGDGD